MSTKIWNNQSTTTADTIYGEAFADLINTQEFINKDAFAHACKITVEDVEFEGLQAFMIAYHLLEKFIDDVDWKAIAEYYWKQ